MAAITVCYEGPIVTRAEALRLGLTYYFTGKPCVHGHIAQRFTSRWICAECNRLHSRSLYQADPSIRAERLARGQRDRISGRAAALKRAWLAAHPGVNTSNSQRRRAVLNVGSFTDEDERRLRETQRRCYICGKRFTRADPATIDHVIALSKGGRHEAGNVALAHRSCNSRKQNSRTHLL